MDQICDLCSGAGTLRDGNPCPRCVLTRWVQRVDVDVVRSKRAAWVREPAREVPARGSEKSRVGAKKAV